MTIVLIIILVLLMTSPNIVAYEVMNATILWFTVLVPTMFPSFVTIDLIENMPLVKKISIWIYPVFKKIFKINSPKSAFIILLSLLCGAPASTKMIQNSLENNQISEKEAQNLICAFSTLSMPYTLMICRTNHISALLYYLLFLILAILWMQLTNKKEDITYHDSSLKTDYLKCFLNSIHKNTLILVNILGILILFKVLMGLLFKNEPIFYPYFEILGGLSKTNHKLIVLTSLGFLGFSVHLQIYSIFENLKYRKFLLSRIYFSLLGLLIFF